MDGVADLIGSASVPVACELGPKTGQARLRRWHRLHDTASPIARLDRGRLEVRYRQGPGVQQKLEELASAEQQCCAFVTWSVSVIDGDPVLHVTAPTGAAEALEPIAALFAATTPATASP